MHWLWAAAAGATEPSDEPWWGTAVIAGLFGSGGALLTLLAGAWVEGRRRRREQGARWDAEKLALGGRALEHLNKVKDVQYDHAVGKIDEFDYGLADQVVEVLFQMELLFSAEVVDTGRLTLSEAMHMGYKLRDDETPDLEPYFVSLRQFTNGMRREPGLPLLPPREGRTRISAAPEAGAS
jgi:hypothetical protein